MERNRIERGILDVAHRGCLTIGHREVVTGGRQDPRFCPEEFEPCDGFAERARHVLRGHRLFGIVEEAEEDGERVPFDGAVYQPTPKPSPFRGSFLSLAWWLWRISRCSGR